MVLMRVISGICRGKKLTAPAGVSTRPTSDRVKEALFSILGSRIDFAGIRVLDVCAGTGSLGIEALSRGAISCCFVEQNKIVSAVLEKNIHSTCCQDRSTILTMDAVKALQVMATRGQCYDLVFFDPPYGSELYPGVLEAIGSSGVLPCGSIMVVECSVRNPLLETYGCLKNFDRRVYGETAVELFVMGE
jgi:16S rRNA (guanine966-N2)-methyltransferase